jgi:hypothetical protein
MPARIKRKTVCCPLALIGVVLLVYGAWFRTIAASVKDEDGLTVVVESEPALMKAITVMCPT